MKAPEGAIIDAIWRCKRGHEAHASYQFEDGRQAHYTALQVTLIDDTVHSICLGCLAEDYGMKRIEFKEG